MLTPIKIDNINPDTLTLTWVLNNVCTNTCPYCPEDLHNGTNHHYEWANAKVFVEELLKRYPKVKCSIAGGEPTLSPHLTDLCSMFNETKNEVGFTTNGVSSIRKYTELSKVCDWICFSYHPEFERNPEWLEEKANVAGQNNCWTTIRISAPSTHFKQALDYYDWLVSERCEYYSVELVKITNWGIPNIPHYNYTDEQIAELNKRPRVYSKKPVFMNKVRHEFNINSQDHLLGEDAVVNFAQPREQVINFFGTNRFTMNDMISRNLTDFNGWTCKIGLESLFINYRGQLRRGNCLVGGLLGNINDYASISWPDDPVKCYIDLCHCTSDVRISKFK